MSTELIRCYGWMHTRGDVMSIDMDKFKLDAEKAVLVVIDIQ
jgi:hypothetical protein